jgi:hypothetical protein
VNRGHDKARGLRPRTSHKYSRQCAKGNCFSSAQRTKSRANGEARETEPCNQGWGPGILSPSPSSNLKQSDRRHEASDQARDAIFRANFERSTKAISECGLRPPRRKNYDARPMPPLSKQGNSSIKATGMFELSLLNLVPMRPNRCEDCDRRFYAFASPTESIPSNTEASR